MFRVMVHSEPNNVLIICFCILSPIFSVFPCSREASVICEVVPRWKEGRKEGNGAELERPWGICNISTTFNNSSVSQIKPFYDITPLWLWFN